MDETIHIEIRCQTAETSSSVKEWYVCIRLFLLTEKSKKVV